MIVDREVDALATIENRPTPGGGGVGRELRSDKGYDLASQRSLIPNLTATEPGAGLLTMEAWLDIRSKKTDSKHHQRV